MLKIFVTGDNHIGLKYASHEKGAVLAKKRIDAFEKMVDTANKENCALFVITGDLFENTYSISKKEVKALLDMLSVFKGVVAVLPGNHDYYDKDAKLWQYFSSVMSEKDNIMLLSEYHPYEVNVEGNEVVLYPALCTSLHSQPGENNLGWIKNENIIRDKVYRIGIAHGAVEGETIDKEGQYFSMKRSELEQIAVDAWLIGHTHVPFPRNIDENFSISEKIFNAGTHVQSDVSCNTVGMCFIVEIDENKTVRAKKVDTGNVRFYRKYVTVSAGKMKEIVESELKEIKNDSVVEIILSGAITAEEYEKRDELMGVALSRFIEGTYNDNSLTKLISEGLIRTEFAETSFSAKFLTELIKEPKEAQLAYELLKDLKEGR